ncbi:uncharacterized protein LOC141537160 [Cotesia typhae]|uniref:uncharacterized protein LOC141537160 n=1 Tax=Cotesia typhae TaxID=2053667 RepID=UPI003D6861EB
MVERVFRYLKGSLTTCGFLIQLFGDTIAWRSHKQNYVALSTCQAECVAMGEASQELVAMSSSLKMILNGSFYPMRLWCDSGAAEAGAQTSGGGRLGHVTEVVNRISGVDAGAFARARNMRTERTEVQSRRKRKGKGKDLRRAVRLLAGLARPIHPREALFLASCLVTLFGSLPPEVVEAVVFFGFPDLAMVAEVQDFEEVLTPNHEDIDRLRIALHEAIFNGLVTMG